MENFWSEHSVWFVIGLILWPRLLLIYCGMIAAGSVPALFGFTLVPRMMIASAVTLAYGSTNPVLIVVCWILAVILDVIGFAWSAMMYQAATEKMNELSGANLR